MRKCWKTALKSLLVHLKNHDKYLLKVCQMGCPLDLDKQLLHAGMMITESLLPWTLFENMNDGIDDIADHKSNLIHDHII